MKKIISELIRKRKGIRFGCDEEFYLKEKSYFTRGVDNNNEMLERAREVQTT